MTGVFKPHDSTAPLGASPPDYEEIAKALFSFPKDWRVFRWECVGQHPNYVGINVTGAVVTEVFTTGRRKGRLNWQKRDKSTEATVTVLIALYDQKRREWEITTGLCEKCSGTGAEWAGWSATKGTKTSPCTRCAATGKAPAAIL